jgi:hypothetical protein
LLPGERKDLELKSQFSSSEDPPKVITLMAFDTEIVEIFGKELIQPSLAILKRVDQSPAVFWFSGSGEWWSQWYTLSLGPAPPGYSYEPGSVSYAVKEYHDRERSCGRWAQCELLRADNDDVAVRFSVQGHHEGSWTGDTNAQVRFTAWVQARYKLNESLKLSAADDALLEAKSVPVEPRPPVAAMPLRAILSFVGTAAYASTTLQMLNNEAAPRLPLRRLRELRHATKAICLIVSSLDLT